MLDHLITKNSLKPWELDLEAKPQTPVPLTLGQLNGGFLVLGVCLFTSLLAFSSEVCQARQENLAKARVGRRESYLVSEEEEISLTDVVSMAAVEKE